VTKLRKHAFLTSRGLEYRECGEWKIEEFDAYAYRGGAPQALYARLYSANRAIWILCERQAGELQQLLSLPGGRNPQGFDVARNSVREIDAEENRVMVSGDTDGDRAMSERISFKPKGASKQTKDCCLLFPDKAENWGFSEEDNPEVIEEALDSLQAEFGRSLVYPPGRLAIYLMEGARDRAKEQVEYKRPPRFYYPGGELDNLFATHAAKIGDLDWKRLRPLTEDERGGRLCDFKRYLHAFDKNAAFLQCVGIPLGIGNYRRHARPPVTGDPGLWLVRSLPYFAAQTLKNLQGQNAERDLPESFNPPGLAGTVPFSQWVTTPTLRLLCELDLIVDIEEAWLADDSHKLFPTYYSRIKQAIDSCDRPFVDSIDEQAQRLTKRFIKTIYVKGIGYLRSQHFKDAWFYRPDWWATIVSEATARIFRDAIEVKRECGAWPVATYIDCLYYVSDHPDPWESFPIFNGRFSNKYKHKGTCPLTPDLASAAERGLSAGDFGGLFKRAVKAYEEGEI
jgi:hypothetical protein